MTDKELFIEKMKTRTKKFAFDVISFCNSLKKNNASSVVSYQQPQPELIIGQLVKEDRKPNSLARYFCSRRSRLIRILAGNNWRY